MHLGITGWWADVLGSLIGVFAGGLLSAVLAIFLYRREAIDRSAERAQELAASDARRAAEIRMERSARTHAAVTPVVVALERWLNSFQRAEDDRAAADSVHQSVIGLLATGERSASDLARLIRHTMSVVYSQPPERFGSKLLLSVQDMQSQLTSWAINPDVSAELLVDELAAVDDEFDSDLGAMGVAYGEQERWEQAVAKRRREHP